METILHSNPLIDRAPLSFYTENCVSRHDVMNLIAIFTNLKYKTWFDCETESADAVAKRVLKDAFYPSQYFSMKDGYHPP